MFAVNGCIFLARQSSSKTSQWFSDALRRLVPQMTFNMHKGHCGRIGVIGGSQEYTGAPYFAAISALKTGADLAHVFCPVEAASVIKAYSPELIVHPIFNPDTPISEITEWLDRLHAVVLGPGLGRKEEIWPMIREVCREIQKRNLPLVVDADGLYFVTQEPSLVNGYAPAILTPNVVEFTRLYHAILNTNPEPTSSTPEVFVQKLANALGGVTIVQKGLKDFISDGQNVVACEEIGSVRRCGGQGDLLSGSLATYASWASRFYPKNSEWKGNIVAAYTACALTKRCNQMAFAKMGRSTTTSDMIDVLPDVIRDFG